MLRLDIEILGGHVSKRDVACLLAALVVDGVDALSDHALIVDDRVPCLLQSDDIGFAEPGFRDTTGALLGRRRRVSRYGPW